MKKAVLKIPFDFPPKDGANVRIMLLGVLRCFRRELENGNIKLRLPSSTGATQNYCDEIIFQFSGRGNCSFGDTEHLTLYAGEVLLVPRQTVYTVTPSGKYGCCLLRIRDDESVISCRMSEGNQITTLGELRLRHSGFYVSVVPALRFASDGLVRRMLQLALVYQIESDIMNIKRNFDESGITPHRLAFRARRIIEDWNNSCAPEISEVAQMAGCSVNYLSTVFRKSYGVTLKSFILRHKLENARHLLNLGEMRPAEVAEFCGFHDAGYFSRIFKAAFGCTPSSIYRGGAENNFTAKSK
ncbi:MAG: helix-turn-helix transcriptional regulator [Lentisphaeria bacterium]|nr:helix-turn-helix transcriptional regulator [Lentisphaeria bacterium]